MAIGHVEINQNSLGSISSTQSQDTECNHVSITNLVGRLAPSGEMKVVGDAL